MTKGQMKEILEKVNTLEKILMRDLEDREIEYLKDHTIYEFLYDVLGLNKEDLLVLNHIRRVISNWFSQREEDSISYHSMENANLFEESGEFEDEKENINFFEETAPKVYKKTSEILASIIKELETERRKLCNRQSKISINITSDSEKPQEFEFNENDSFNDLNETNDILEEDAVSIKDAIPESAKKWILDLTQQEIIDAIDKATNILVEDYINTHQGTSIDTSTLKLNEDEAISEIVDQIKNVAIKHYVSIIEKNREFEFNDSEIQSEVLDYLYKNNYKVKSINNKVSLV